MTRNTISVTAEMAIFVECVVLTTKTVSCLKDPMERLWLSRFFALIHSQMTNWTPVSACTVTIPEATGSRPRRRLSVEGIRVSVLQEREEWKRSNFMLTDGQQQYTAQSFKWIVENAVGNTSVIHLPSYYHSGCVSYVMLSTAQFPLL